MSTKTTVAALRQRARDKPGPSLSLRLLCAETLEEKLCCIEDAVEFSIEILVEHRHLKSGLTEDQRTSEIIGHLRCIGLAVTHDEQIGGHVDIAIRMNGLLWLAEAKNWRGCKWASAGIDQLMTRYMTGIPSQAFGGLIVYFDESDVTSLVKKWKNYVCAMSTAAMIDEISELGFRTRHRHQGTGLDVSVRHFSVPLFWKPI